MIPPIASKFVAGESPADAVAHVEQLGGDDIHAILNLLGEHLADPADAAADTEAYIELIDVINQSATDACISVKPSQIGFEVSAGEFEGNLERIITQASATDVFVWIDMEDHTTTDATLDAYERFANRSEEGVGVCLQANLKRTRDDLERLTAVPGKVRLVKGAYDEPKSIAYRKKSRVNESYRTLMEDAFVNREGGIAIGSHDPAMISYARELNEEHGTPYEVQMLMGVRSEAQRKLAADGVLMYQYVPYGNRWLQYFYRRVRERKENLWFAVRAVIGR